MQKERCRFCYKQQLIKNIKFQVLFRFKNSFSPFPYGTYSLSIINTFQILRVVPQY